MSGTSKANQRQSRTRKRQYDKYKNEDRYAKNKIAKLLRHLARLPSDTKAKAVLIAYGKQIGKNYADA